MRIVSVALLLAGVAGCASQPGAAASPPSVQTMRVTPSSISAVANVTANVATVPYSVARVWEVLPGVYESFSIPIGTIDVPNRTIGNSGFKIRRQLGKVPLSRYLECGSMQATPSADSYDVYMSVLTQVSPDPKQGTIISTTIDAQARPVSLSGQYSSCSSKGTLEQMIADQVKLKGP